MTGTLRLATVDGFDDVDGLVHGFEQRLGPPGWETRGDGRRRVAQALAGAGRLLLLTQVHGSTVVEAPWDGAPEGDAAVADGPGLILGIETADCLPILLVDPRRRAVASAHAGWRGSAAGVAGRAARGLVRRGSDPADIVAALGPAIGACCYEVGPELGTAFPDDASRFFHPGSRGRLHLDLRGLNEAQLQDVGIPASRIRHVDDCTFCRADLYHSFRREGRGAGRMVSFVGFRH